MRKITIYDTKTNQSMFNVTFASKVIKIDINNDHLLVASKEHIFVFTVKDMEQIAKIKAPNHLLRLCLSPNISLDSIKFNTSYRHLNTDLSKPLLAYSDMVDVGLIKLVNLANGQFKVIHKNQQFTRMTGSFGKQLEQVDEIFNLSKDRVPQEKSMNLSIKID